MRKFVIVPAYNEEENLRRVLRSIREEAPDFDVVVVNDGSPDKTAAVARRFDFVKVINLVENIGIGYPPAALFLILIMGLIVILIHFSVALSDLKETQKKLVQETGFLRRVVEDRPEDS